MGVSILIVDDDRLVVEKLINGIGWARLGITDVLSANNIRQAMEILEEVPVDILLSDIEMPQGNGLELLEWVRDKEMPLDCIFLSSYALFAYAQKAIRLNSCGYLLKPVSNKEMEQTIAGVVEKVHARKGQETRQETEKLKNYEFWQAYLLEDSVNPSFLRKAQEAGIFDPACQMCLVMLRILPKKDLKKDVYLNNFIIRNVTEEFFGPEDGEIRLKALVGKSDFKWFFVFDAKKDTRSFREKIRSYREYLSRTLPMDVCIYIGRTCAAGRMGDSRKKLDQMECEAVPGEDGLLYEEAWSEKAVEYMTPSWKEWEKSMMDADRIGDVEKEILSFVRAQWKNNCLTVSVLVRFRRELMQTVYSYLNRHDVLVSRIFDGSEFDELYEKAVYTVPDMEEFIHYVYEKLSGFRHQDNRQESVVEQMKKYINAHLKEDLSRKVLANAVFLSEDYISKIFVNVTGMSIPNYVTSCRMQKAQEYLRYSDLSVSRIALEVGYSNFSYFSKSFRDYAGCTPNEFRSKTQ
ncbi:MAG: response regulator [Lachnospiraceae bacterium]|nr:response regulator [Lachnospiraceae bacterium]